MNRLAVYGFFLSLTHFITFAHWLSLGSPSHTPICWPFLPDCESVTSLLHHHWLAIMAIGTGLSVANLVLYLAKQTKAAYVFFAILSLMKLAVHLSDYRMMGNYHYMSHLMNFAYLLLPEKDRMLQLLLVLFYLSAGVIKFNSDWLSGSAMVSQPLISGKWLEIGCAYVIFLELALAPLLLSANKKTKYAVLFQFVCFHLFSWHIVGYFYPLIMLSLLSAFCIFQTFQWPQARLNHALIALFIAAQAYPLLFEQHSSLNGRGRLLALNMLDAWAECETRLFIKKQNFMIEYVPHFADYYAVRIQCDPTILLHKVKQTCLDQASLDFVDIDLDHQIKRRSDDSHIEQFTFQNVCRHPLHISGLGHLTQEQVP